MATGLGLALGLVSTVSAMAGSGDLAPRRVTVDRPDVVLGMVADLTSLPSALRAPAMKLRVASFRPGQNRLTLSSRRVLEQARARMPILAPWLPSRPDQWIELSLRQSAAARPVGPPEPSHGCMRLTHALPAGALATSSDFNPVDCDGLSTDRLPRFRLGLSVVRARRDLPRGEVIAAVPSFALAQVTPGQALFVSTTVGPVRVEREVHAIQAAPPGRAFFAQAADGAIFAVPAPQDLP